MKTHDAWMRYLLATAMLLLASCSLEPIRQRPAFTADPTTPAPLAGPEVAGELARRYADNVKDCGNGGRPAFLCSGVIIRGTGTFSKAFHSWNPSPKDQARQSVSASFLRNDMKFNRFGLFAYNHGIVFYPIFAAPVDKFDIDVRCVFPIDGGTDARQDHGCGLYPGAAGGQECVSQGIRTASQWLTHYRQPGIPNPQTHMCGFSVTEGTWDSAFYFMQLPEIMAMQPRGYGEGNELIMIAWPQNMHRTLPIEAFFYMSGDVGGLQSSRSDQVDFYDTSRADGPPIVIPIIRITFPSSASQNALFQYVQADQSVP